jgi:hypothetical protein
LAGRQHTGLTRRPARLFDRRALRSGSGSCQTDFDFFVIQQPNAPFGMAWYQADIETNAHGVGYGHFIGRFNEETFIVAPGSVTPFNGEHDAGVQVLNTSNFPDLAGPLLKVKP